MVGPRGHRTMPPKYATGVYTIKQTSSKYDACIKHSLYEANIELAQAGLLEPLHLAQM